MRSAWIHILRIFSVRGLLIGSSIGKELYHFEETHRLAHCWSLHKVHTLGPDTSRSFQSATHRQPYHYSTMQLCIKNVCVCVCVCVGVCVFTSSESSIFQKALIPSLALMVNEEKTFSMATPDTMDGRDTLKEAGSALSDECITVWLCTTNISPPNATLSLSFSGWSMVLSKCAKPLLMSLSAMKYNSTCLCVPSWYVCSLS